MAAAGPQVQPDGQFPEKTLGLGRDVIAGPTVAEMRELLGAGALGLAATVLIVRGHRGVVVAGDSRYAPLADHGDDLVGPGGVADEVAEVVDGTDVIPPVY
ncbi:MAG: hypothetical protein M3157_02820, partial [Actinomycetota bacterium]|nr:hypothetical protein [Actinomycetota bacterium]